MSEQSKSDSICCPEFDPTLWDDKVSVWENKKFIKDKVCTFLNMPLNFGNVMRRLDKKVTSAGAKMPDWLCLSDHTSKWNMDVYLAVDQDVSNADMVTFTGKYYSKVYEGPFQDTGKWCKDFDAQVKAKELVTEKMYMWYTTCPKCAKKYGKNYVVILSEIH